MRSFLQLALYGLASAAMMVDIIKKSTDTPIEPTYPIGVSHEPFAKVKGRLFDINGTVSYFSGVVNPFLSPSDPHVDC
jgi:hypothetical protein